MIAGHVAGLDRLAARLLARARGLASGYRAVRRLPAGAAWRRPDLLWPDLLPPPDVPPPPDILLPGD